MAYLLSILILVFSAFFSLAMALDHTDTPNGPYAPPKAGEPALHRAARIGDNAAIRKLVSEGANINASFDMQLDPGSQRKIDATPLMVAAGSGDGATVETVQLLLELNADAKITLNGSSAAVFAARGIGWNYKPGGDAERLSLLLKSGSPLPSGGLASRLVADVAGLGDIARLRVLIEHQAPVNPIWNREKAVAQEKAIEESLKKYTSPEDDMYMDLPEDTRNRILESQTERLKQRASAPYSFEIPVFQAAESGCLECLKILVEHGAQVDQLDNSKESALWYAASVPIAKFLIDHGLSIEARNIYDWTPLASSLDDPKRVQILLKAGANPNATFDQGYTVFMSAVGGMERSIETLRMLVDAGANPNAISELGFNAFHAAIDVNGEANEETSVRQIMKYLKELGIDIEHRNKAGFTPLGRAIENGTGTEVKVLCELGANVHATTPCSSDDSYCSLVERPMIFAAISSAVDRAAKLSALISSGAKLDSRDEKGRTPLQFTQFLIDRVNLYPADEFKTQALKELQRSLTLLQ